MTSLEAKAARIRLVTLASLREMSPPLSKLEMALPVAARLLAAQDGELEAFELHIRSLAKPLRRWRNYLFIILWVCAVFLAFGLWLLFHSPSVFVQSVWLFPGALIFSYFVAWPRWQHTALAQRWVATRKPMPSSLVKLISELREGLGGTNAGTQAVDYAVLASALATLLCSDDEHDRTLVRSKSGRSGTASTVLIELIPFAIAKLLPETTLLGDVARSDDTRDQKVELDQIDGPHAGASASQSLEDTEPQYNRIRFAPPRTGLKSSWVRDLGVTADELLDRVALIKPPPDCTIPLEVLKVLLGASLTILLKQGEEGRLKLALAAGKQAVKELGIQGYSNRESDDWIRKLIAPPVPWIRQQLSTASQQTSFSLLGDSVPLLP